MHLTERMQRDFTRISGDRMSPAALCRAFGLTRQQAIDCGLMLEPIKTDDPEDDAIPLPPTLAEKPSLKAIYEAVCDETGLDGWSLRQKRMPEPYRTTLRMAIYIMYAIYHHRTEEIGRFLDRSNVTVHNEVHRIAGRASVMGPLRIQIKRICERLA